MLGFGEVWLVGLRSVLTLPVGSNIRLCCTSDCGAVQVEVGGHRFSTEVKRKKKLSKEQLLAEAERKQQERQALQHSAEGQVTARGRDRLLAVLLAAPALVSVCAGSGCQRDAPGAAADGHALAPSGCAGFACMAVLRSVLTPVPC